MEKHNRNTQLVINLLANFVSYAVVYGINIFLSPYIVRTVGVSAYGFIGLANNFVSYASLITLALNALAGRFITIKIHEKNYEEANKYFTSVLYANSFLAAVILIIETIIWVFLEYIINIPVNILYDVKILFAALFLNCIVSTIGSVFSVATYATNKLYLTSFRTVESNILRAVILISAFSFLSPKVWYIGVTTFITGLYCLIFNIRYTKKLLPFINIKRKYFDLQKIIQLVKSGVWSLISKLGAIFTDGLDLLVTNIFIDASAMGILSIAKTIPALITSVVSSLVDVFSPNFTILFAEKKQDELVAALKQSMKIMGVIANLPVVVLVVCGRDFFQLWQPTQDEKQLYLLALLTCGYVVISGGINCIYNIFIVVNKIKVNSLMVCLTGFLNTIIVFVLLKTTSLGVYAVAGVSTLLAIIRNLAFTLPYGAYCLKIKWYSFYPDVIRPIIFVVVSSIISWYAIDFIQGSGWLNLCAKVLCTGILSLIIGVFVILRKEDRQQLINKLKNRRNKNG